MVRVVYDDFAIIHLILCIDCCFVANAIFLSNYSYVMYYTYQQHPIIRLGLVLAVELRNLHIPFKHNTKKHTHIHTHSAVTAGNRWTRNQPVCIYVQWRQLVQTSARFAEFIPERNPNAPMARWWNASTEIVFDRCQRRV